MLELAVDVWAERRKRVPTGELNRVAGDAAARQEPPAVQGQASQAFYATQAGIAPPTFVFFAREAGSVHFSYRRYLENRLRDSSASWARRFASSSGSAPVKIPRRRGGGRRARATEGRRKTSRRNGAEDAGGSRARMPRTRASGPAASPRVAVVGSGAWGTTLALLVARTSPSCS